MTLPSFQYPVIGFFQEGGRSATPGNEIFRVFRNEEALAIARRHQLAEREGMVLVDNAGRTVRIAAIRRGRTLSSWWFRALLFMFRQSDETRHMADYDFVPEPPIPFDEVKRRVTASIDRNQDDWIDDEAMAGEAGEPLRLEPVISAAKRAVYGSTTVEDLFERLDEAWPY